ncbi:tetratricopeptide repeat protein [Marine Group I thaumarchaeote]|uniref:Tetratricopeptide repeat protein n=1 Tax=Marine Group I thaumarchaeote TaxID=2511932 RepID=A0A7K4NUX2_9ARCH|nr:tetratricopeptide repeat protein [Marine Group I thaumarchaeote]
MSAEKFDPFISEWTSFSKNPNYNLIEKCLKMAQILEYPELDISKYVEKINDISNSLKAKIGKVKNSTYLISMLNEHLFDELGFYGAEEDYYDPGNSFLNIVLDKKTGIPITLSIIYSEVAKNIGLDLQIVGFPGHVIVKYKDEVILDPFYRGRLLTIEDLEGILNRNFGEDIEFVPEYLNSATAEQLLTRLLRNLKNAYTQSYAYDNAMKCTDMILGMRPESPEEIRDKGILEERLLRYDKALPLLNKYLELEPEADDADFILELIKSVREKSNQ